MSRKLSLPTELKPDLGKPWLRVSKQFVWKCNISFSPQLDSTTLVQFHLVISLKIGKLCSVPLSLHETKVALIWPQSKFVELNQSVGFKFRWEIFCCALTPTVWPLVGVVSEVSGAKLNDAHSSHRKAFCNFCSFLFLFCVLHVFPFSVSDWSVKKICEMENLSF